MSIARVVTIFQTQFKDFTFNTYDFCWPILEYGVAILVCCGPLLRPVFEKFTLRSLRIHSKRTQDSDGNTILHTPGQLGFSQLSEGEIPLNPVAAPSCVTSITGNAPRDKHQMMLDEGASKDRVPAARSKGVNLPSGVITVENRWDVGDENI